MISFLAHKAEESNGKRLKKMIEIAAKKNKEGKTYMVFLSKCFSKNKSIQKRNFLSFKTTVNKTFGFAKLAILF